MSSTFFSEFSPEERAGFDKCTTAEEISAYTQQVFQNHLAKEGQTRDAAGRFAADAATKVAQTAAAQQAALDAAAAQKARDNAALHAELVDARQQASQHNLADAVYRQSQLAEQFRSGAITPEQYMQATGAIEAAVEKRLKTAGFDIELAAGKQLEERWIASALEFAAQTPDFPFGEKNKELLAMEIQTLGLVETNDRVGAMTQAYHNLKERGLLFAADVTQEEVEKLTDNATPEELLAAWKESLRAENANADPSAAANEEFIRSFQNGRSSSVWGK